MGKVYSLEKSQNVELTSRYFTIGLIARDTSVYQATADLLGKTGRMKFVRPLYRKLALVDRSLACETFKKNESFYHPICRAQIKKDLEEVSNQTTTI